MNHGLAIGSQCGAGNAAFVVVRELHISRVDPVFFAIVSFTIKRVGNDHALSQQTLEWLIASEQAFIAHEFMEKARVEQVQNGVFDAADVLIDWQPLFAGGWFDHGRCALR